MQKIFIMILLVLLTACVRKISIEQGNVLTPDTVNQIHLGMSPAAVKHIIGTPQLLHTFNDDRVSYVYTFKPGRGQSIEKQLTLTFEKGKLININRKGI